METEVTNSTKRSKLPNDNSNKKRRTTLTKAQKKEVCILAKNNPILKHQDIANKFGVGRTTITEILTKKEYYLNIDETSIASQQKRNRQAFFPQLEETLALWFDEAVKHNLIITGEILKTKGHAIANILNINNFNGSDGWLSRFKKRHHIYQVTKQGEAASAPLEELPQFRVALKDVIQEYSLADVYNADETALFWDLEPSKTLAHGPMAGTKKSKSRVTVLLSCNALGDKLTPVFIHKHQNPRALKGIKKETLPVYYYWNSKGWMQTSIFQHWLKKLDEDMRKAGRNILLLLDNCSSHVVEESMLTNIRVHFFPPNTTSHLQPCDAGIIWSFKCHYRKLLCQNRIEAYDLCQELNIEKPQPLTIYNAIKFVSKAWNNVSKDTIIHSWQKTDILPNNNNNQFDSEINDGAFEELEQLIRQIPRNDDGVILNASEFIQCDDDLEVNAMPEIEEIVAAVCYEPDDDDDNEIESEIEIKTSEALESCEKLIKFIQQQDKKFEIDDKLMSSLKKLQKDLQYDKLVSAKQMSLDIFFNN